MARLTDANVSVAKEIIGRYPRPKSALIPLLHLAQEQDGYVTNDAMAHIAELIGHTPAEVLGTATFYEMFKFEPVGKYLVNICGTMSCALLGADELMHHAEERLGIKAGGTTPDGLITLEHAECQAACTEAPCLQVNYRYRYRVTPERPRPLLRRPARRRPRRRDPAARHARHGPPAHPGRPRRRPARPRGRHRPAAVDPRRPHPEASVSDDAAGTARSPARPGFIAGDRPRDRHVALRATRTPTRSTRYLATGGYEGLKAALATHARRPSTTRSARPPCSVAAAPASRPASSGASPRRACGRATSSSTATRASRARTRTAC